MTTRIVAAPDKRPESDRDKVAQEVRVRLFELKAEGTNVRLDPERRGLRISRGVHLADLQWLQHHAHEIRDLLREEREDQPEPTSGGLNG